MNKNIFKICIILFLSLFSIIGVNAITIEEYVNNNTNYKVVIEDDAELLTAEEINQLQEDMIPLTEFGHIAFKTISENVYSAAGFAEDYYYDKFGTSSGTLFLIDMDNRMIYIFSDGANNKIVTTAKANIITDNVYTYATNEEYYECASEAFYQIETILNGGKIAEPMRHISNILISITVAFFVNFIIVLINSKVRKAKDQEILSDCNISFNIGNINGVKVGTHRVYSPSDSSSGGGSSGGGGGGGSSGSGGGHSF